MRKFAFILALLISASAGAQNLPEKPQPAFKHVRLVYWTGVTLLAASTATDALETRLQTYNNSIENNPLFGTHPSSARIVAVNAAGFAAVAVAFHWTEQNRRTWIRWGGRAALAVLIEEHFRLAACDAHLANHPPGHPANCGWF